jgi:polyhydroxybutyrate depolymerase
MDEQTALNHLRQAAETPIEPGGEFRRRLLSELLETETDVAADRPSNNSEVPSDVLDFTGEDPVNQRPNRLRFAAAAAAVVVLVAVGVYLATGPDDATVIADESPPSTIAVDTPEDLTSSETTTATSEPATTSEPSTTRLAGPCGAALTPGVNKISLDAEGQTYDVRVFVPAGATDAELLPTVVGWHPYGLTGPEMARLTGFETLADQENFLAVFPTGHRSPDLEDFDKERGWELPDWVDSETKDDVAFATALFDLLEAEWCTDPVGIFSIGYGDGAWFNSVVVCEHAGRVVAVASVAGVLHPESCEPERPVPFLAIHSELDALNPLETGVAVAFSDEGLTPPAGTRDSFSQFTSDFGCAEEPATSAVADSTTLDEYPDCDDDVPLRFYLMGNVGQVWPGSPETAVETDLDATTLIWDFFQETSGR